MARGYPTRTEEEKLRTQANQQAMVAKNLGPTKKGNFPKQAEGGKILAMLGQVGKALTGPPPKDVGLRESRVQSPAPMGPQEAPIPGAPKPLTAPSAAMDDDVNLVNQPEAVNTMGTGPALAPQPILSAPVATDKYGQTTYSRMNLPEEVPEYGLATYSDTERGATKLGFDEDLAREGQTPVPLGVGMNLVGQSLPSEQEGLTLEQRVAARGIELGRTKPLGPTTGAPAGEVRKPSYPTISPFERRKKLREMKMAFGDISEDVRRGRISAKEAAAQYKAQGALFGAELGLSPADLSKEMGADFRAQTREAGAMQRQTAGDVAAQQRQQFEAEREMSLGELAAETERRKALAPQVVEGGEFGQRGVFDPASRSFTPFGEGQYTSAAEQDVAAVISGASSAEDVINKIKQQGGSEATIKQFQELLNQTRGG